MFLDIVIPPDIAEQISNTNVTVVSYKIGGDLFAGQIKADNTGLKLIGVTGQSTSSEDVQTTMSALVQTTRDFLASGDWNGSHLHIIIEGSKTSVADVLNLTANCREVSVVEALKLSGGITPKRR